jgi:hypothetical protein
MYKLVVLCVFDPLSKMRDREEVIRDEFETESQVELRALRWMMYRPHDICMLVGVEQAVCKHCDMPIEEKPGWVVHRYIHAHTGAYACLATSGKTKAEPKEIVS